MGIRFIISAGAPENNLLSPVTSWGTRECTLGAGEFREEEAGARFGLSFQRWKKLLW